MVEGRKQTSPSHIRWKVFFTDNDAGIVENPLCVLNFEINGTWILVFKTAFMSNIVRKPGLVFANILHRHLKGF